MLVGTFLITTIFFVVCQVVDVGQFLSLMDDKGLVRYDLPAPDGEVGKALKEKCAADKDETIQVDI